MIFKFFVIFHFYIQYRHYNSFKQQDITHYIVIFRSRYIYLCIELILISQVITYEILPLFAKSQMCPYIVSVQLVVTVEYTLVFSWKNRCLPCIGKGSSSLQAYQHSTNIIYSITNVHTSWTTGLQFYTCTTTTMVNIFRIKTVISLRPLSSFLSGQSLF